MRMHSDKFLNINMPKNSKVYDREKQTKLYFDTLPRKPLFIVFSCSGGCRYIVREALGSLN
jgi:hypothetical protein